MAPTENRSRGRSTEISNHGIEIRDRDATKSWWIHADESVLASHSQEVDGTTGDGRIRARVTVSDTSVR
jgi:hypothetical protein